MKYEKKDIKAYCIGVIIAIALILSIFSFLKILGYKEVCIAEVCSEWAYGEDWIKDNCILNKDNKYEMCNLVVEGQSYNVPLKNINLSVVRSCRELDCASSVLLKEGGKIK